MFDVTRLVVLVSTAATTTLTVLPPAAPPGHLDAVPPHARRALAFLAGAGPRRHRNPDAR